MHAPSAQIDFYASTLEHKPLHTPEKVMLKRYFEESGQVEMGALAHWEHAGTEGLHLLEAWIWGMRYWGRETLFRVALSGYTQCRELWREGDEGEGADTHVKTVKMGAGNSLQQQLDTCMRWARVPSELLAMELSALRGEGPEAFLEREVPAEDHQSVFAWTLIACHRMVGTILDARDEAARLAGQAIVCGARSWMAVGMDEPAAIVRTRARLVKDLRAWMGRKW